MSTTQQLKEQLSDLMEQLHDATAALVDAEKAESEARKDRCSAANRLNAAQKQLDEFVQKMRNAAPSGSGWGSARLDRRLVGAGS